MEFLPKACIPDLFLLIKQNDRLLVNVSQNWRDKKNKERKEREGESERDSERIKEHQSDYGLDAVLLKKYIGKLSPVLGVVDNVGIRFIVSVFFVFHFLPCSMKIQ